MPSVISGTVGGVHIEAGYERLTGPLFDPRSVRWWYAETDASGRVVFARGGRVRKARDARRIIDETKMIARREAEERKHIPTHRLTKTGGLEPL